MLVVVVGGVVVDDPVGRLAGLPALGGDAVGGLHEVFARAIQLEEEIGDLVAMRPGHEARVPRVDVVVAHAFGNGTLAAREPLERGFFPWAAPASEVNPSP